MEKKSYCNIYIYNFFFFLLWYKSVQEKSEDDHNIPQRDASNISGNPHFIGRHNYRVQAGVQTVKPRQ